MQADRGTIVSLIVSMLPLNFPIPSSKGPLPLIWNIMSPLSNFSGRDVPIPSLIYWYNLQNQLKF